MPSGISKRFCRYISQEVYPWNERFAHVLPSGSSFAARDVIATKDARALARELLVMTPAEFSTAFKNSPMKRAKLRGLRRNAAVVLANAGPSDERPCAYAFRGRRIVNVVPSAADECTDTLPPCAATMRSTM